MDFGNRLKMERENRKMSQEDFAKKLGVSRSSIGNYETNRNMPTAEILNKMADIFDCTIDYLLCKSDIRIDKEINLDEMEIAFASGIKGLNKENQQTLKSIMEGLLAKQKMEDESKKRNE